MVIDRVNFVVSQYTETVEANNTRVKKNLNLYSKRQEIIEHVFWTIKRQWGYDHILLKGLGKNDREFGIIYLIFNFRRVINIFGGEKAKKWLKSQFSLYLVLLYFMKDYMEILKYQFKKHDFLESYWSQVWELRFLHELTLSATF